MSACCPPPTVRMSSRTPHLTEQLIACRSVTPHDGGLPDLIRARAAPAAGLRLRAPSAGRTTSASPICGAGPSA